MQRCYGNVEEDRVEKFSPKFSVLALWPAQGCSDVDMITPHRSNWLPVVPEIHVEFLEFWHRIKPKNGLPTRDSFTEDDLERWSGYLHFVELIGDEDAKYIVYGSNLGELLGRDWTGKRFSETEYEVPKTLLGYYHDVRDARRPLAHVVNAGAESKYRRWSRLFIPFGDDTDTVRYIMVHSVLIE